MEGRGGEGKGDVRVMTSVSVGSISRTQALGLVRVDGEAGLPTLEGRLHHQHCIPRLVIETMP